MELMFLIFKGLKIITKWSNTVVTTHWDHIFQDPTSMGSHSRVGAYVFQMLGRRERDTKEILRHRIVSGRQVSEY